MSTESTVANEVQKQTKEKQRLKLKDILLNRYFLYCVSLIIFFTVWDVIAANGLLGMPRIMDVLKTLVKLSHDPLAGNTLLGHIWASLRRVLIGFVIAVIIGVPLGLLMAVNPYINKIVKPIFDLLKPMPPIAWIPIAILWFGVGDTSKIFLIVIGAVIPCIINSYNGIRLVDPELYDVVRMLGGTRRQMAWEVTFPAAFPAIFGGIQLSLSFAWTCVVAAELVSARAGLGFLIILGMQISRPAMIIGGMAVIALISWLITVSLTKLEKVVCPWKREIEGL